MRSDECGCACHLQSGGRSGIPWVFTRRDLRTNGALYYANLEETTSGWFFRHIVEDPLNHPVRARIGHQVFYA